MHDAQGVILVEIAQRILNLRHAANPEVSHSANQKSQQTETQHQFGAYLAISKPLHSLASPYLPPAAPATSSSLNSLSMSSSTASFSPILATPLMKRISQRSPKSGAGRRSA